MEALSTHHMFSSASLNGAVSPAASIRGSPSASIRRSDTDENSFALHLNFPVKMSYSTSGGASQRSALPMHEPEVERVSRHETYYIPSGDVVFLVENVFFRIHRYFLVRESIVFRDMLSFPNGEQEGSSEMRPIVLQAKSLDFARFLWVFYNPKYSVWEASVAEWTSILSLAHRWHFPEVKRLAVEEMEKLAMPAVEKAVLAQKYDVGRGWLEEAYAILGSRAEPITIEDGHRLGLENAVRLSHARERIREARRQAKESGEETFLDEDDAKSPVEYRASELEIVREIFHFPGDDSTVGGGSDVTSVAE